MMAKKMTRKQTNKKLFQIKKLGKWITKNRNFSLASQDFCTFHHPRNTWKP